MVASITVYDEERTGPVWTLQGLIDYGMTSFSSFTHYFDSGPSEAEIEAWKAEKARRYKAAMEALKAFHGRLVQVSERIGRLTRRFDLRQSPRWGRLRWRSIT